jgi:glycosyltransferase involved in cell wall biosynthesis
MLSVLIPTYNYNAFILVNTIHQQLVLAQIAFEIICFDDGSKSELNVENEKINSLENARFKVLENNIGRSAIRNLLAKEATHKWLLFLDADVLPTNNQFIKNYIACFNTTKTVFCGGLLYQHKKENLDLLRYKFGKKHEEISLEIRKKNPNKYFFTSNFLIEKEVFKTVIFEETLKKYGREDLLFSLKLIKSDYKIEHLENEVYHLGIDENKVFVAKTKKAMENLVFLEEEHLIENEEIALLKVAKNLKNFKLSRFAGNFYPTFEKLAIENSNVFYFNCMKVCYVCFLKSGK